VAWRESEDESIWTRRVSMTTPRGEVCKLLNRLSDDSSLKDIQYHGRDLPNNAATLAGVCLEAVVSLAHMAKRGSAALWFQNSARIPSVNRCYRPTRSKRLERITLGERSISSRPVPRSASPAVCCAGDSLGSEEVDRSCRRWLRGLKTMRRMASLRCRRVHTAGVSRSTDWLS
jgi:hypothetical protein